MKKFAFIVFLILLFNHASFADVTVFEEHKKFGLKNEQDIVVKAKYKKLVRLGTSSWIMQDGIKFGIINNDGNVIVEPKYNQAERVLGKYVKFRKGSKYCLLNEYGENILINDENKEEFFNSIDLLYGGLIVTSKNYKYGLSSFNGKTRLENVFDDIYMPDKDTLVLVYGNKSMEFNHLNETNLSLFNLAFAGLENTNLTLSDITTSPLATTGYYGITFTDYVLKLFSSISPAYEQTIDELMFSQGADTVSVIMKLTWLPMFPFVYAKNYYNYFKNPSSGPLNKAKKNLRKQINNDD